ncbi:Testicular haploid expressed repeat [Cinara cedri]|uniref:Testicular haploid expressed repeat n=1 Tax=Cinara cedri TaxID=506608 RepID=A0A5E4NGN9_9HEMI|nr:Testicular haploid expressed repeat [Cinara cedri]
MSSYEDEGKSAKLILESPEKEKMRRWNDVTLFKIIHRELLAKPVRRRCEKWPNPLMEGPYEISQAALKAKASDRLITLAEPKKENMFYEMNYFPKPSDDKTSDKLLDLKRLKELATSRKYKDVDEIEKKSFKNKMQWTAHLNKLKVFAAPKRTPPSPLEPERKTKNLNQLLLRLKDLSMPANRPPNTNDRTVEEMRTIKKSVLKHKPSERILKLAQPKALAEETLLDLNYDPRERFLNAKYYKASKRIQELASPILRANPKSNDINMDAFKVSPTSLKAKCSKRVKELAMPIKR